MDLGTDLPFSSVIQSFAECRVSEIRFLSQSTNALSVLYRWQVAYIPTLFSLSILLLVLFVQWEMWREKHGKSVLLAVSIFKQPRVGAFFALVFLVWWSFNVQQYFVTL